MAWEKKQPSGSAPQYSEQQPVTHSISAPQHSKKLHVTHSVSTSQLPSSPTCETESRSTAKITLRMKQPSSYSRMFGTKKVSPPVQPQLTPNTAAPQHLKQPPLTHSISTSRDCETKSYAKAKMTWEMNQPISSGHMLGTRKFSQPLAPLLAPQGPASKRLKHKPITQPISTSPIISSPDCQTEPGADTSSPQVTKKRTRGPAKAISDWGEDGFQLRVNFNDIFHPVGKNASKLITQLGVLIRNSEQVPLTYANWSEMPHDVLSKIWNDVEKNVLDCPQGFKDVCFAKCGRMWKHYKCRIKSEEFLPRVNDPDIYENRPERVPSAQWKALVDYWYTDEAQEISVKASKSRGQRGPPCHTGRTHLQELAHQVEYDRLLDEIPEEERTAERRNMIFLEVFGPDVHGYCRSVGSGIHPSIVNTNVDLSGQEAIAAAVNRISQEYNQLFQKEHLIFRQKLQGEYDEFRQKLDDEYKEHLQKLKEECLEIRQKTENDHKELLKKTEHALGQITSRIFSKYF